MPAVHQEEQEALYQHIHGILPDDRAPVRVERVLLLEGPDLTTSVDLRRLPKA